MNIDLTQLSTKELLELKKAVEEENKSREDGKLRKSSLGFGEERFYKYCIAFDTIFKEEKGLPASFSFRDYPFTHPLHIINKDLLEIVDYVIGNFDILVEDLNNLYKAKDANTLYKIRRGGPLILNNPERYKAMYWDLMAVIDKYLIESKGETENVKQ